MCLVFPGVGPPRRRGAKLMVSNPPSCGDPGEFCENACVGYCRDTIDTHCAGLCCGVCDEECSDYDIEENCSGTCPGWCTGACILKSVGLCEGDCIGECE